MNIKRAYLARHSCGARLVAAQLDMGDRSHHYQYFDEDGRARKRCPGCREILRSVDVVKEVRAAARDKAA